MRRRVVSGARTRRKKKTGAAHLVDLVADDHLDDLGVHVRLELAVPPRERVEGLAVRDVVDEDHAVRAAVVRGGDGAETLLAGGILVVAL